MGGWEKPISTNLFARHCERTARHLGGLISYASTFNEPNLPMLLRWISNIEIPLTTVMRMSRQASRATGTGSFGCFFLGDADKLQNQMIGAHCRGLAALKSGPGTYPVGLNVALQDEQAVGPGSKRDKKCAEVYGPWLEAASSSDFLDVQTYTRCRVGKKGDLGPEARVELTQMGYDFWPDALAACLRYAAARVTVPIYVTETAVATEDDSRRCCTFARRWKVSGKRSPTVSMSGGTFIGRYWTTSSGSTDTVRSSD